MSYDFNKMYDLPVKGEVEQKNGLDYLSWAFAWATLLGQDPTATKKVYETPEGGLVWKDPIGGHVKVSVTAFGVERIEYLPVMDYKNQAVAFDKIDSMAVNKTVQRAVTKAIAQFGIGLKLYAGEDLPTEGGEPESPKADEVSSLKQIGLIKKLLSEKGVPDGEFIAKFKHSPDGLTSGEASAAISWLTSYVKQDQSAKKTELMDIMKSLDPQEAVAMIEWSKKRFGLAPNELTDEISVAVALAYCKRAQENKAKSAEKAKPELKIDDDLPF